MHKIGRSPGLSGICAPWLMFTISKPSPKVIEVKPVEFVLWFPGCPTPNRSWAVHACLQKQQVAQVQETHLPEIELKFLYEAADAAKLRTRLRLFAKPDRAKLIRSVYFDTPDRALEQAGYSLRLRQIGRNWLQTVKARSSPLAGLSHVTEIECAVPAGIVNIDLIPDPAVRSELQNLVNGTSLTPVFATEIRRTTAELKLEDGSQAELAMDQGHIIAGADRRELREIEIELVKGDPAALYDFARPLFLGNTLRFSRLAKADRGYRLAAGKDIGLEPVVRLASMVHLRKGETSEQAATLVLKECFEQISANADLVAVSDDVDGPHQLRIGLRRLRSAFSVFRQILDCEEMRRLKGDAEWLAGVIGNLRDLDVVIVDVLEPEVASHPEEPGFGVLRSSLQLARDRVRQEVRGHLKSEQARNFLLGLSRFIELGGWRHADQVAKSNQLALPVERLAKRSLKRRWKKARRRAHAIDNLGTEERHELRKELKKLRYAVEFFGSLYRRKEIDRFQKQLKKLQIIFGELNDAAMSRRILTALGEPAANNIAAQRASGLIIGARSARAEFGWSKAKALWRELCSTAPF